jgi:hypothetical protein
LKAGVYLFLGVLGKYARSFMLVSAGPDIVSAINVRYIIKKKVKSCQSEVSVKIVMQLSAEVRWKESVSVPDRHVM